MHKFDPKISIKDNYLAAYDIDYAAWDFAGHDHREDYRDSGQLPERTAWLHSERIRDLKDALAEGQLVALGISKGDPDLEIREIPSNLFLSGKLSIDPHTEFVTGLGLEFQDVRVCRAAKPIITPTAPVKANGRPSHIPAIMDAWERLRADVPGFLELDKSTQNREIREMAARLYPVRFPGKCRIGESTIRRHRRTHPALFV